jgi:protein-tyrosine phosphatase
MLRSVAVGVYCKDNEMNYLIALLLGLTLCFSACNGGGSGEPAEGEKKPGEQKIRGDVGLPSQAKAVEKPGLPNCYKVSDDLYRGARPTAEGFKELKKLGVKTIVNLQSFHSDRDNIGDTNLAYEHIYMKAWNAEDEEIVRWLQIITNKDRTPVFVHCKHGADRTGTMVAIYRIAIQGWSKEDALKEMKDGPFGHHKIFKNLRNYIKELDIAAMKKRAGLKDKPKAKPEAGSVKEPAAT